MSNKIKIILICLVILVAGYFLIPLILGVFAISYLTYQKSVPPESCPGVEIRLEEYFCKNRKLTLSIKNTGTEDISSVSYYLTDKDSGQLNNPHTGMSSSLKNSLPVGDFINQTINTFSETDRFMILTPVVNEKETGSPKICLSNNIKQYFSCG